MQRYRFVMLGLEWLTTYTMYLLVFCLPPVFPLIMSDLNLTYAQVGLIFATPSLMLAIFAFPGSLITDNTDTRRGVGLALIILGISGLLRSFASNFTEFFFLTCFIGLGMAIIFPFLPRIVAAWFPYNERGVATGIYNTGILSGSAISMVATLNIIFPLTGNWRGVMQFYGIFAILVAVLWWGISREKMTERTVHSNPMSRVAQLRFYFSKRMRNIWLVAGIYNMNALVFYGLCGWLPTILSEHGIIPTVSSFLAAIPIFLGIAVVFISPLISNRIGLRKPFLWIPCLILVPAIYFTGTTVGLMLLIGIIVFAFGINASFPMFFLIPLEFEEPGQKYIGRSMGLIFSIGYTGGLLGPWIVGYLRDVTLSFTPSLIVLVIASVTATFLSILLPETGRKSRK